MNVESKITVLPSDKAATSDTELEPVSNRPPRVLIADDEEDIRSLTSAVLASAGLDVDTASDGLEAWDALLRGHYDLVITDNDMPHLAGLELIRRIREMGMHVPVIIVSGALPIDRLSEHRAPQVASVLTKPFCMFQLLDVVQEVLHPSLGISPAHFQQAPEESVASANSRSHLRL